MHLYVTIPDRASVRRNTETRNDARFYRQRATVTGNARSANHERTIMKNKNTNQVTLLQIAEALNTVLEIDHDDTKATAFFQYSGHTKGIYITVYPNGWEGHEDEGVRFYFYEDLGFFASMNKTEDGNQKDYETFVDMMDAVRKAASGDDFFLD